ncbi:tyrosine-type recombinase/integrase [Marinimicrobium sp. ABcell2]|uniref:tyrosine-type recombinase/integrase n=1 Tax=Marinimicrobium sp. ABcell2 TaxID=3069751 RepID=UPI0027AED602|nr:tyrosine-type recombinase/integrase [Marinimicrobium sp. ABcell2]MDQ2075771.1 tyrosine-type recombinase/integrase [Marinimicrobium sp. ABcell2]
MSSAKNDGIVDGITGSILADTVMAGQKLTDAAVKQAQPKDKAYKLPDGAGLYLLVQINGTKCWRYDYRFAGKRKTLAIGTYPLIGLKAARAALAKAKNQLAANIDPAQEKQRQRREEVIAKGTLFSAMALEWWEHQKGTWTEDHAKRIWTRIESDALPFLGHRPIAEIQPQDVIAVVRRIEHRDALDVAARVLQDIRRICRYAVQTGRLTHNPASDLSDVLKGRKTSHRASLPREQLPGFLGELEQYEGRGRLLTKLAIKLLVLTFVRSGELRGATWEEFDLQEKVWRIPASRMKMGTDHIVPLSAQAVEVIEQIKPITGQYDLVFPSEKNRHDCMSDNTMRRAIFKMGYDGNTEGKSKAVPHGFRATASSILNETGFNPDAIERQLSHMERNGVRAAYTHHARYLEERSKMMQWWADYLDTLRVGGENVVPFSKVRRA